MLLAYDQPWFTYRAAVHFINNIKDLLLAFSLPLVLIDVTRGRKGRANGHYLHISVALKLFTKKYIG